MNRLFLAFGVALLVGNRARADSVYFLSTGDPTEDAAVSNVLTSAGDTVTVDNFTNVGNVGLPANLSSYNTVVLGDYTSGEMAKMSTAAQQSLLNYVSAGGGLVTTEWTVLDIDGAGELQTLQAAIPVSLTTTFGSALTLTYGQSTANVFLNHGVSSSFTFTTDSQDGSETDFLPKAGATVYYTSSGGTSSNGLIGWKYGAGEVLSFSTLAGPTELSNSNYAQLFVNAVNFAGGETAVPEPSRLTALAGLGGMCLGGLAWRLRRRRVPPAGKERVPQPKPAGLVGR